MASNMFPVQLCLPLEQVKKRPLSGRFFVSRKLDGVYCIAHIEETTVTIYSRTGKEYKSLEHLKPELYEIAKDTGTDYIIFEAYVEGVEQPTISGAVRDTKKQHIEIRGFIHDALTEDDLSSEGLVYSFRYTRLYKRVDWDDYTYCKLLHQIPMETEENIMRFAQGVWDEGGEGIIVRDPMAHYHPGKRDATMIKVKKGVSYDLEVVAVQRGTGKYQNALGAIDCRFKDGKIVRVGTGFTDEERFKWSPMLDNLADEIMHKVVQIDAMSESTKGVLREPRFKGIRHDKTKGDF